jgi:hypothetical protein
MSQWDWVRGKEPQPDTPEPNMTRRILAIVAAATLFACAEPTEGDLDTGYLDEVDVDVDEKVSFQGLGSSIGTGNVYCETSTTIRETVGYGVSRAPGTAMANAQRKAWEKTAGVCGSRRFAERGTVQRSRSGAYLTNATYAVCYSCE